MAILTFPTINFTDLRVIDGETDEFVRKFNDTQMRLESWADGMNSFRLSALDNTAFPVSGGTLDGSLYATGAVTSVGDMIIGNGTNDNSYPILKLNSGSAGNPVVQFARENTTVGLITGLGNRLKIEKGTATFELYENAVISSVPVRVVDEDHADAAVTRSYVNDNFLSLDGGALEGNLVINAATGNPDFVLKRDGVNTAGIFGTANYTLLRRNDSSGNPTNQILIRDYETEFQEPVVCATATTATDGDDTLTTKGFIDDNFASIGSNNTLTGANIFGGTVKTNGYLVVNSVFTSDNAVIDTRTPLRYNTTTATEATNDYDLIHKKYVDDNFVGLIGNETIEGYKSFAQDVAIDKPSGNPLQIFRINGKNEGLVGLVSGAMRLRTYKEENGSQVTANELVIFEGNSSFTQDVRCNNMGEASTSLTTKEYVDDNFVDLASTQTVDGRKTFTNDLYIDRPTNQATLVMNSGNSIPALLMRINNVEKGAMYARDDSLRFRRENGNDDTVLDMYNNYIAVNKPIIGVDATSSNHLVNKGYVDDNYLNSTIGGTVNGDVTITDFSDTYLTLDSGNNPIMLFKTDGDTTGRIYSNETSFNITHYDVNDVQNSLKIYPSYSIFDRDVRVSAAQGSSVASVTRKDYVDSRIWKGTQAQYNALGSYDAEVLYVITG